MDDAVTHVSDTALWVATYRAMESERPDALFHDPYARRLAGEKGERIVRAMPSGRAAAWPMIVRTKVFDEIIDRQIAEAGVDTVLNLAAGLDTRAYRLSLPSRLRWYDVDFPAMVDYKAKAMREASTACKYEAIGLDLSDVAGRRALFDRVNAQAARVLVVSEGLLIYLKPDEVAGLAADLAAQPRFASWVADLAGPGLLKMMNWTWGRRLKGGRVAFHFAPEAGPRFFEPYGWRAAEYHANWTEAKRLNRRMRGAWMWDLAMRMMPAARRERYHKMAGTVLFERSNA